MLASKLLLLGVIFGFLSLEVLGHSYLTAPQSRSNQKQTNTGCRGPNCLGPCDAKNGQGKTKAVNIARGASITLEWPRNNHAGGFIRVAWAQTSQSDNHAVFDSNVQEIFCHERGGCKPDDPSKPNGGDSGPTDGSVNPCRMSITVPLHLTDGTWTLQWSWFGGAFALGDYYSCVDYTISGGPSGSQLAAFFVGGDYSYPGQDKCKFFNTDRLHRCVNEPCDNPVYTLNKEQSGPAYGVSSGQPQPTSVTTAAPKPITTARPPVTTGRIAPATTGKSTPVAATTGRSAPATVTTGIVPPVVETSTSSVPVAATTGAAETSGGRTICTAATFGAQECTSDNTYRTCLTGRDGPLWSAPQTCQVGLTCHPSDRENKIYCY